MKFTVLETGGADGGRWRALVERLEPRWRDLHYLPEYASIYERAYGYRARLAWFGDDDQYVIQPFAVRPLDGLPFLAAAGVKGRYFDIASIYGYGGPAWRAPSPAAADELFDGFDRDFTEYCRIEKFASEFCCLHPILENQTIVARAASIEPRFEKPIVAIDLSPGEEVLWRNLSKGHRSGISKARRSGVKISQVPVDARNLAVFSRLYFATMDRHHAEQKWYFRDTHFTDCVDSLTPHRVALFFAEADGGVAAAGLVLHDENTAYYHYAGSDERYFSLRPTNCLVYETMLWAKRAGKLCYHLGGGLTDATNDMLPLFKTGFGPDTKPLYVYGRVHDDSVYKTLCDLKRAHETTAGSAVTNPDYFPFYRR
ncbi:MAG: peptidoglycan bridge formation glycyltransferase FemA/FemB family protein [Betaproteobacteria bacterium]